MCLFCGGIDPTHDQLIVQAVIAGGITTPWMLRDKLRNKLREIVNRVRGKAHGVNPDADACALADEDSA